MKKILITGGTGLIGKELSKALSENGHEIRILTRKPVRGRKYQEFAWSPDEGTIDPDAVKNIDGIIHLAGAGIADKRWTSTRKKVLYNSRIETANLLFRTCKEINHFPGVFISASGISIYGADSGNGVQKENQTELGKDFIANLAKDWEKAALQFEKEKSRVVCLRTGIVLTEKGGALPKLSMPIKFGLGAPLGSGKQYMSWIHMHDLIQMYVYAIEKDIHGAYNAVSSEPVTNKAFMKKTANILSKPFFLPNVPSFALKIALGEMAEILLGGNNVSNEKIIQAGFIFQYPDLNSALNSIYR